MSKEVFIPEERLRDLYLNQRMSSIKIAKKFNCCQSTILKRLRKIGVKIREPGLPIANIAKDELKKLYIDKRLSTWKIAEILKHSRGTIYRKLKKFGIKPRDISDSHIKYPRKPFSQDPLEKAYIIGFAIGDLRIRKAGKKRSKTIKVDCRSTKFEQIKLIYDMFKNYGRVWISKPNKEGKIQIEASLDESFNFLLDLKSELKSILDNDKHFICFLAGFIDAEGSIFISNGQAKFSIGNYNYQLLRVIRKKLLTQGIDIPKLQKDKKLYVSKEGYKRSNYYWHLNINKKDSLIKLFGLIGPYLRHEKRISDMQKAIDNIKKRNN